MNNLDKYIDNLFEQKLSGTAPKPISGTSYPKKNWVQMQKALKKKAFLKFSLTNFNIYYLSAIISAFVFTGSIFLSGIFEPQNETTIVEKPNPDNTLLFLDSLKNEIQPDTFSYEEVKNQNNEVENTSPENEQDISEIEFEEVKREKIEPLKPLSHCVNKKIDNNQKKIDTLIPSISHSDTIIMIDTVKVTKKKLILQKKN